MFITQFLSNLFLFFIGVFGIVLNKRDVLILLMCIELIFLSVNLNFILFSVYLDDFYGQLFPLFILTVVAGESAIGLAILILYYRIRGNVSISQKITLKG